MDDVVETIDAEAFREAMSRFASAVHIVTTDGPAGLRGVTATAVVSVSDAPATILVCLNAGSVANERFLRNAVFAVNTLSAGWQDVARVFAGSGGLDPDTRFASAPFAPLATGAPVLRDALAAFDCRVVEARQVATHHVLIGEVVAVRLGEEAPPLLYHARGYRLL